MFVFCGRWRTARRTPTAACSSTRPGTSSPCPPSSRSSQPCPTTSSTSSTGTLQAILASSEIHYAEKRIKIESVFHVHVRVYFKEIEVACWHCKQVRPYFCSVIHYSAIRKIWNLDPKIKQWIRFILECIFPVTQL